MKKVRAVVLCVVLCLFCISCTNVSNQSNLSEWVGKYEYSAVISLANPSAPLGEVYNVTIYQEKEECFAQIDADGWMLYIRAKAQVRGDKNSIELVFLENTEKAMQLFQKGDVIIKFIRDGENIITNWISIAPELGAKEGAEGIYFVKII